MANENNLEKGKATQFDKRSGEELAKISKKGGKASAKKRQQNKTFKEIIDKFLNGNVSDKELKQKMIKSGFADEEINNKAVTVFALWKEATRGNTKAFELLRDTVGEKPKDNINISGNIPIVISGDDELED